MENFEKIYNKLTSNEDSELHIAWEDASRERKKIKKIISFIFILADSCFLVMFIKILKESETKIVPINILIFAVAINIIAFVTYTAIINSTKKQKRLRNLYKSTVIKSIINNFYDNVEYLPNQCMPENIYKQVNYEYYNKYKSDDYIKAKINQKYNLEMAEILTTEEEIYTNSKGERKKRIIKKFHGLFSKLEIDKSINSELKIVENGKIFFNENRLQLDSSEFEKYFDVQSTNSIIGMQILTADIMEELVDFERKTKIKYDIYIKNNEIYLRFHTGPMFEMINRKNEIINREVTNKYFNILKLTYSLTKKIIDVIENVQI